MGIIDNKKAFKDVSEKTVKEYWIWNKKKRGFIIISAFLSSDIIKCYHCFANLSELNITKKNKKIPGISKNKNRLNRVEKYLLIFPSFELTYSNKKSII